LKNKAAAQGGILSDDQRQQLNTIANQVYAQYQKAYTPIYNQETAAFDEAGIDPSFSGMIPDLNSLSTVGDAGTNAALSTAGQPAPNGQTYTVGQTFNMGSSTVSYQGGGIFTDSDGNSYNMDPNGNLNLTQ